MARTGKYSAVIDSLPRTLGTEPDYQAKVNATKAEILSKPSEVDDAILSEPATDQYLIDLQNTIGKKVNDLNEELIYLLKGKQTGAALCRAYREVRRAKDTLEEALSTLNLTLTAYSQLLVDQYEVEGTSSIKLETGESVSVQWEPVVKVEDKGTFRAWCVKNGLEDQLHLHWQTANALAKERVLLRAPNMDGTVTEAKPKLVLRGA